MAIKLKNAKTFTPSTHMTSQQDALINDVPLPPFPEHNIALNPANYPTLRTRPYTYVPGHVAYDDQAEMEPTYPPATALSSKEPQQSGGKKQPKIPIILHPDKRGGNSNAGGEKKRVFV
jgi:hypothetical protein